MAKVYLNRLDYEWSDFTGPCDGSTGILEILRLVLAYGTGWKFLRKREDVPLAVMCSPSPYHWRIRDWGEPEAFCARMNQSSTSRFRQPDEHVCRYEIEEVGAEEFALVCNSHPEVDSSFCDLVNRIVEKEIARKNASRDTAKG